MVTTDIALEALVGHLFVVGGRTISSASPGSIAMPPPRRAARGRDDDSFFGLLSLAPNEHQPASFYESLTETITGTYFDTGGSVTYALREAIGAANEHIYRFNRSSVDSVTVGLACAVLRGHELYIATVGPAHCFLVRSDGIERMPSEFEMHERTFALGAELEPDVRLYHHEIWAGDFLLLADQSLSRLTDNTLRQATSSGGIAGTVSNLSSVAGDFSACEVIQFVEPLPEEDGAGAPAAPRERRLPSLTLPAWLTDFGKKLGPDASPPPETSVTPAKGGSTPTRSDVPAEPRQPRPSAKRRMQVAGRDSARGLARVTAGMRMFAERTLPSGRGIENPLEQRLNLSMPVQIGIALGVALIVALLTTVVYRMRSDTSEYAQFVREAQSEVEEARSGKTQAEARPHWEMAAALMAQAAEIREPSDEIMALQNEALAALDSYDHVTRVEPVLLRSYEPGSYLRGPVVHGLNLYVIDTTQDILYREDLDDGSTQLTNRDPIVVTQKGELVGGQVIGGLVDLAWMEDGGVPQRNVLAVVTNSGQLITYSPSWDVSVSTLPGSQAWADPRAIAVYESDLYVLDAGANEIWHYSAGADAYTSAPSRTFTDVTPDLSDAQDMEIDSNGNFYVLHSDGSLTKYFMGREEAFAFGGLPQPITRATALFLNVGLYDRTLFIADPSGGRLYTTALNGTFLANYKDGEDTIFDNISGVYSQEQPALVYVTAANQLYYFSRP